MFVQSIFWMTYCLVKLLFLYCLSIYIAFATYIFRALFEQQAFYFSFLWYNRATYICSMEKRIYSIMFGHSGCYDLSTMNACVLAFSALMVQLSRYGKIQCAYITLRECKQLSAVEFYILAVMSRSRRNCGYVFEFIPHLFEIFIRVYH